MTRPVSMARFDLAWPWAGVLASVLSGLVLFALSLQRGLPGWMPLNATTQAFYGPEVAGIQALDLAHTGLGAAIHVIACFFWSGVAVLLLRKAARGGYRLAWLAGLVTATIAGIVDYGLLPERLSPGWHLVLPPLGVALGFAAMGAGIALGLCLTHARGKPETAAMPVTPPRRAPPPLATAPAAPDSALEEMRHPAPHVLDQRQQRIDPADAVTDDPNRQGNGMKQPGNPEIDERPDR